jgi:hypothetical protein
MSFAGDGQYIGLSGERPTAGIGSGTRFRDKATGDESYWNGSIWVQAPRSVFSGSQINGSISGSPSFQGIVNFSNQITVSGIYMPPDADDAKYIVWESAGVFRTLNKANSTIEYSGTNAALAISTAQSGAFALGYSSETPNTIKIADGKYLFQSGQFSGFNIWERTHIKMGTQARLMVPHQYSGWVFRFCNGLSQTKTIIEGGFIGESGVTADVFDSGRNWDAFFFQASGAEGIDFVTVRDTYVLTPNRAIYMRCDDGYITSTRIDGVIALSPRGMIQLDTLSGANGISRNRFHDVTMQGRSGDTRFGVNLENLAGSMNVFDDCKMWDIDGSGTYSCHIGVSGFNTIIIGGTLTPDDYIDSGRGTFVTDDWEGVKYNGPITATSGLYTSFVNFDAVNFLTIRNPRSGQAATVYMYGDSGSNNPSISWWNQSNLTERLLIQKTTINNFRSSRNSTSGVVRPTVFQMHDGVAGTTIEALQISTSGNVVFNTSGGTVQFYSGNTSLTKSDTATNSGFFAPLGYITARLGTLAIKVPYFAT